MPDAHIHHLTIGNLPAIIVEDDTSEFSEQDFNEVMGANAASVIDDFRATAPHVFSRNILALHTPTGWVVIDAGLGGLNPAEPGKAIPGLQAAGIDLNSVAAVIITHFHGDHVGGLMTADRKATFPNAKLIVPELELAHWMNPEVLNAMPEMRRAMFPLIFETLYGTQLVKAADGTEIWPGIRYIHAPGHTPGHAAVQIESNGTTFIHIADAAHLPLQTIHPDRSSNFDPDKTLAATTRTALLERLAHEKLLMMAYHFPWPGLGHIHATPGGMRWSPVTE